MKQKLMIIVFLLILANYGKAQFIDKYGFSLGLSYSNQLWNYKQISIENPDKDYKAGIALFITAEKNLGNVFSIRSELGYIQKGFKNNVELIFGDGTSASFDNENVIFNDIGLSLGLKISLFDYKLSPYGLLGFRSDYMFSYKDVICEEPASGLKFNVYKSEIEKFNKLNIGALIAIGFEYNDFAYIEFEYNPSISQSYQSKILDIKDNCWAIKLGFNLSKPKENIKP